MAGMKPPPSSPKPRPPSCRRRRSDESWLPAKAIFRTFFDTGVRLSGIVVNLDDVDLTVDSLRFLGKGRKPRTVPFSPSAWLCP